MYIQLLFQHFPDNMLAKKKRENKQIRNLENLNKFIYRSHFLILKLCQESRSVDFSSIVFRFTVEKKAEVEEKTVLKLMKEYVTVEQKKPGKPFTTNRLV